MPAKDGRMVSGSTFVSGLIIPLYNDDNWPLAHPGARQPP